MKTRHAFAAALLGAMTAFSANADDTGPPPPPETDAALAPDVNDGYLTFYLDNDLFGGTDENYTNGARLSWISKARHIDQSSRVYRFLNRLTDASRLRKRDVDWVNNLGISLTQLMFTPEDIAARELLEGQRPYAGWLGVGFSLHAKTDTDLHTMELSLGVVGPASGAENTQDFIHDLRDIDKAQGWDHQLENEFTVNLHYRRAIKAFEWSAFNDQLEMQGIAQFGADLGNAWIIARAGGTVRIGYNLPADFSDPKLSATAYTHQLFAEREERARSFSAYLIFAAEGRAVGRDIFLDGNTFADSHSVDKRPFVADLTAGVGLRYKRLRLTYAHTYRTEEFRGQDGGQVFGSLALGLEF